jgi:hypothetical protein
VERNGFHQDQISDVVPEIASTVNNQDYRARQLDGDEVEV